MSAPLDSRQLRAFVTLARTGSFTVAAKELFLSQSAVSHSLKALESDVGCLLLDRVGKKIALTPAGEQLLYHSEKILQSMEAARGALTRLEKWGHARLRLAASATACQYVLPHVLRKFQEKYPQHVITIEAGNTSDVLELLRENRIDLAIGLEPKHEEQFQFEPLFHDELSFIVAPSHPWAVAGQVIRDEIEQQKYILYSKTSITFRLVEDYFRKEKMPLKTVLEVGSIEATKELVKLGLGISILAPWVTQKELQERSLMALPLGRRKLKRTWGILSRQSRQLSLAEETFIDICRQADWLHQLEPLAVAAA
jgi:LysR family transcriptional regulator, low CO2-responsive transcriptional regulator